jgi:hypothetical protein
MVLYNTLQNYTSTYGNNDLSSTFCYANSIIPFVAISILFPLFMIILLSTFFATKRMTGRGDIWASASAASFITMIAGVILSLVNCTGSNIPLVNTPILMTCVAIFIVSIIILFLTRD